MPNFKARRHIKKNAAAETSDAVSLNGEDGRKVATNLQNLALGKVAVEDLGSGYSISPSGTIRLRIADVSLSALFD